MQIVKTCPAVFLILIIIITVIKTNKNCKDLSCSSPDYCNHPNTHHNHQHQDQNVKTCPAAALTAFSAAWWAARASA